MNRALMEDQGGEATLTHVQVRDRFVRFAREGYRIDLFEADGAVVGFASHRADVDEGGRPFTHLRQFFIAREHRRTGLGRAAFELLAAQRWPSGGRVTIDVRESNPGGRAFWESVGFAPLYTRFDLSLPASSGD